MKMNTSLRALLGAFILLAFYLKVALPGASLASLFEEPCFPKIPQREDLPIFAIYYVPSGMTWDDWTHPTPLLSRKVSSEPTVIFSVWEDGYCVRSKDRLKGGEPYLQGRMSREAIKAFRRTLRDFKSPVVRGPIVPDSSWRAIVFHEDQTTTRCIALRSSHENFPMSNYETPSNTDFFRAWRELRSLADGVKLFDLKPLKDAHFEMDTCQHCAVPDQKKRLLGEDASLATATMLRLPAPVRSSRLDVPGPVSE